VTTTQVVRIDQDPEDRQSGVLLSAALAPELDRLRSCSWCPPRDENPSLGYQQPELRHGCLDAPLS
jgi:hypothetical protein